MLFCTKLKKIAQNALISNNNYTFSFKKILKQLIVLVLLNYLSCTPIHYYWVGVLSECETRIAKLIDVGVSLNGDYELVEKLIESNGWLIELGGQS
jgi:hypothetical protein